MVNPSFGSARALAPIMRNIRAKRSAKLNKRQTKQVKSIMSRRQELKYTVAGLNLQAMNSTPLIYGITDIAQGDTDTNRNGDRIMLVGKIEVRYKAAVDPGNTLAQQRVHFRVIIFQWHPVTISGGANEPAPTDVLLVGASGAIDTTSPYNHDQRQMYKILYDKTDLMIGPGTVIGLSYNPSMNIFRQRRISTKRCSKQMQYVAGSSVNASNHIYFMWFADVGASAQNPTISWETKVFFRDS